MSQPARILTLIFIVCSSLQSRAQSITKDDLATLQRIEDSLLVTADSMYNAPIPDDRVDYAQQFARQLVRALKIPNSYTYGFDKLAASINVLSPDDKQWRIFNWTIAPEAGTRRYYGAIQMKSEQLKLFGLADVSSPVMKGLEDSVFTGGHWLGALYYRVISQEVDGQTLYTLFGVNASSGISSKKFLDPMRITDSGPVFGATIFDRGSETSPGKPVQRFILEYKKDVQVSMNWSDEFKAITFDHLESETNDPARKYTYVPSGQVDGFRWSNGWHYVQNLVPAQNLGDGSAPNDRPLNKP